MRRFMIWLTERQYQVLRQAGKARDVPTSQIIRDLVEKGFALDHEEVQVGRPYRSPPAKDAASLASELD